MRTYDEIKEVASHPTGFLKSDLYKSAFLEIYSFLKLEDLPETFVKHLNDEQKKNWKPSLEEDGIHLVDDIKEELSYLRAMLKEDVISPAMDRTPRLLALLWVNGYDVTKYDNLLMEIRVKRVSEKTLKTKLLGLYIRMERDYNLK